MHSRLSEISQVLDADLIGTDVEFSGISIDSRTVRTGELFVALMAQRDGHQFVSDAFNQGAVAAIVCKSWLQNNRMHYHSPALAGSFLQVDSTQGVLAKLAEFWLAKQRNHLTVIGITGSVGKTTTKDLLASLLKTAGLSVVSPISSFNNEIGVPLTIFEVNEHTQYLILELGAYQRGDIADLVRIAPLDIAAITKIGSAHLSRFGSLSAIAEAKAEIFEGLVPGGIALINSYDQMISRIPLRPDIQSREVPARFNLNSAGLAIRSPALVENLNLATEIAATVGVKVPELSKLLALSRAISPHRLNLVDFGSAQILDDSYNANPESMRAALETMAEIAGQRPNITSQGPKIISQRPKIALLGTMLELGPVSESEHLKLGVLARECGIEHLAVIGEFSDSIISGYVQSGPASYETLTSLTAVEKFLLNYRTQVALVLVKASYGIKLWTVIEKLVGQT
jgi:UDP-N-acetylmuramoyl-tripeptide--D-alanyl-D-alanine ligase